jgi:hypothetical protein
MRDFSIIVCVNQLAASNLDKYKISAAAEKRQIGTPAFGGGGAGRHSYLSLNGSRPNHQTR